MESTPETIAALKQENADLRQRLERYRALLDHLPVGIQVYDVPEAAPKAGVQVVESNALAEQWLSQSGDQQHPAALDEAVLLQHLYQPAALEGASGVDVESLLPGCRARLIPLAANCLLGIFEAGCDSSVEEQLREQMRLQQDVLDHSPMAIYAKDRQGRYLLVNQIAARWMRVERIQILGKTNQELFAFERAREAVHSLEHYEEQIFQGGQISERELNVQHPEGPTTYTVLLFPIYDQQGTIAAVGGITKDISERKQAEQALRESEGRYRALSEMTSDFVYAYTVHPDGQLQREWITDSSMRITGFSRDEMDRDWMSFIHPQDVPIVERNHQQLLNNQSSISEFRVSTRDGETRWLQSHARPVWDPQDHRVTRIYGAARDITERKQAEQALAAAYTNLAELNITLSRSRDLLRTLFDGLEDGLVLLDERGTVQIINRAMASLFGSTPEELVGKHWLTLCQCIEPTFPSGLALESLHDQQPHRSRTRTTDAYGQVRILDMQTFPLPGAHQVVVPVVLRVVDMTERLELEALAIQHETFAAGGRLAAAVAHEVNTPLQAIQNFLYLAGESTDSERQSYLELVSDEIDRISAIIRQLLDLYRSDTSTDAPVDMNRLIGRVLLLTNSTLGKHRVVVEKQLSPSLPLIWGRSDQLTQVILNLIINAADAMPRGGRLTLHTRVEHQRAAGIIHSHVIIEIADSGTGINPEIQPRIFDSFFTTKPRGTGLGLAICRTITEQHGGTITVRSTPGEGSTFCIRLPIRDDLRDDDTEELF